MAIDLDAIIRFPPSAFVIFNDWAYADIREDLQEFMKKYADIMSRVDFFSSFQKCHSFFWNTIRDHNPIHKKILSWRPAHPETRFVRDCLMGVYQHLQSEKGEWPSILGYLEEFGRLVSQHMMVEAVARRSMERIFTQRRRVQMSRAMLCMFCDGISPSRDISFQKQIDDLATEFKKYQTALVHGVEPE